MKQAEILWNLLTTSICVMGNAKPNGSIAYTIIQAIIYHMQWFILQHNLLEFHEYVIFS